MQEVSVMRELLYNAAENYQEGRALAEQGDIHGAISAYTWALHHLHAVKPLRERDALLAQVYLSRYQVSLKYQALKAYSDLRMGYSYAKMTKQAEVRELAERLWQDYLTKKRASVHN
ncbi:MAG: hypothetical protein R2880_05620 [Deinococcales bacterium]